MEKTLETIFNEIQTCDSKQFSENLSSALGLIPRSNAFLGIIDTLLLCQKNSVPPKISHFVRRIFEELGSRPAILQSILAYVSDKLLCKSNKVRRNSLRIAGTIVSLHRDLMSSELIQRISERLFDKEQSVRKEALKICLAFQDVDLAHDLKVQATLKDAIRYDQSHEIRRLGLLGLDINASTINCVLERCIDTSSSIRRTFWMACFPKIDMRRIPGFQRIYLMKKAFTEREFDAKEIFIQRIREMGIEEFIEYFYCEEPEYTKCIEMCLGHCTIDAVPIKHTPEHLHFMLEYYKCKEDVAGRDSLGLAPLEEHLQALYLKCCDLESMARDGRSSEEVSVQTKVVRYLFKMLEFYDIITDESRKYITSIVSSLITRSSMTEIVEESVVLAKRVCGTTIVSFLGSIVKRTRGQPICYILCEHIMKHIPFGEMHEAIMSEIAMMDIGQSLNIFYWYLVSKRSGQMENLYLSFLPNKRVIEGAADLALMGLLDVSKIEGCLLAQVSRFNEGAVIPASKLLLARKINDSRFVRHLLLVFYASETDHVQQYLALFFYEFFRTNALRLAEVYCDVLEMISSNHKTFVDQSLFWVASSELSNGQQHLFFRICLYILNNYESLRNKKHLFGTLDKITVLPSWDSTLTKKIITLVSLIVKKRPRENVNVLLARLMEVDDGAPLAAEEYEDLRRLVNSK